MLQNIISVHNLNLDTPGHFVRYPTSVVIRPQGENTSSFLALASLRTFFHKKCRLALDRHLPDQPVLTVRS